MNKRYPALWHGLIFFVAVMLAMYLIATPVQYYYGLWGVAITELLLLLMALLGTAVTRKRPGDVMPLKLVSPLRLLGCFLLYGAVYVCVIPLTSLMMYFFPQMNQIAEGITEVGTQYGSLAAVIIMAVLPAICEESVFRGFILASFKSMGGAGSAVWKLFAVIGVGALFGIFHLSPARFLMTGILGALFTYVAIETESMLPSMLLHLVNNLISVVAMYTAVNYDAEIAAEVNTAASYGIIQLSASCAVYFGVALILGWFGSRLIKKRRLVCVATAAAVVFAFILIAGGYAVNYITAVM